MTRKYCGVGALVLTVASSFSLVEIQARFSSLLRAHEALCRLDNLAGAACQKLFQRACAGQEELRSECHGRR